MQFSTLFLAAAAATLASAVKLTNSNFAVTAGTPFNITWSDAEGPVTLVLKNGPSTALTTVSTIGSGLTGTSYSWTPSSSLDTDLYAIEIQDSTSTPNYSQQFQVSGATAVASTVTASSTSASSASGSSTSGTSTESSTGSSTGTSTGSSTASSTGSSTSNGTSTSASSSPTASGNSSTTLSGSSSASRTSASSSRTASSSSTGGTASATSAPTSAAAEFASPLAFIFLAFAAIVTLN
ncbi:putative extracellular matrix protein [Botrytis fragariae]|uniref:Putative extracellular matrix protein n=1 Tax=Botrytis fragariae TaxID=1964551 RepID=A0A8H6AYU8_9HELO|nr:putative extracellular matrix protein [Botrytis fragariae]KAF5876027.1 putative extracellular matrix protein [Botrytis fragariae]